MRVPAARLALLAGLVLALLGATSGSRALAQAGRPGPDAPVESPVARDSEETSPAVGPGEALTIYLMTMGPGDHPFYKFGHNALWIHDEAAGTDRVYNYGTFSFGSAGLIPKFFLGRFLYSLSRRSLRGTLRDYRQENRSIVVQRLNLTPAQRAELRDFLLWNARPQNRYYRYDYYRDNCSTRVRDALDKIVAGRLRQAAAGPGTMTYRDHTLRLTASLPPEYVTLLVVLGPLVDQPIGRWEESFLPEKLQELVRSVTVPGPNGEEPLVLEERTLLEADRSPTPTAPPRWLGWFLSSGAAAGGALAVLGWAGQARRSARISAGILLGVLGLVAGFLGTSFCMLWALTDHQVAYRNENILQLAPWLLALPLLAVGVARGRAKSTRRALVLCTAAAAVAALGFALKLLPWFQQANGSIIAFALPLWTGAALALRWLERAARPRPSPSAPATRAEAAPGTGTEAGTSGEAYSAADAASRIALSSS